LRNNAAGWESGSSCYFKDLCAEFDSIWQVFSRNLVLSLTTQAAAQRGVKIGQAHRTNDEKF
jgi:hypothetical protein